MRSCWAVVFPSATAACVSRTGLGWASSSTTINWPAGASVTRTADIASATTKPRCENKLIQIGDVFCRDGDGENTKDQPPSFREIPSSKYGRILILPPRSAAVPAAAMFASEMWHEEFERGTKVVACCGRDSRAPWWY